MREAREAEVGDGYNRVRKIEGFGPPIDSKLPESMGGGKVDADGSMAKQTRKDSDARDPERPNIPQPKKFVMDPDSPIYKRGDPNQPGEKGKAIKIDKKVGWFNYLSTISINAALLDILFTV